MILEGIEGILFLGSRELIIIICLHYHIHPMLTQSQCKALLAKARRSSVKLTFICDLHGHSKKKDAFVYGCNTEDRKEQAYPLLFSRRNEDFSFQKSSFKVKKSKRGTGRVVGNRELGVMCCYTLEASFAGASQGSRSGLHYNEATLGRLGGSLCEGLYDWHET